MRELISPGEVNAGGRDMLTFRVGGEWFAAPLASVDEAVDLVREAIEPVPGDAGALDGVFRLRDALVPLYAPQRALGVAAAGGTTALVLRAPGARGRAAIAVDDVDDVVTVCEDDIRDAGEGAGGIVRGVIQRDSGIIAILDLNALVAACRATDGGAST